MALKLDEIQGARPHADAVDEKPAVIAYPGSQGERGGSRKRLRAG